MVSGNLVYDPLLVLFIIFLPRAYWVRCLPPSRRHARDVRHELQESRRKSQALNKTVAGELPVRSGGGCGIFSRVRRRLAGCPISCMRTTHEKSTRMRSLFIRVTMAVAAATVSQPRPGTDCLAGCCPAAMAASGLFRQQQLPLSFSGTDPGGCLQGWVDKPLDIRTNPRAAAGGDAGPSPDGSRGGGGAGGVFCGR